MLRAHHRAHHSPPTTQRWSSVLIRRGERRRRRRQRRLHSNASTEESLHVASGLPSSSSSSSILDHVVRLRDSSADELLTGEAELLGLHDQFGWPAPVSVRRLGMDSALMVDHTDPIPSLLGRHSNAPSVSDCFTSSPEDHHNATRRPNRDAPSAGRPQAGDSAEDEGSRLRLQSRQMSSQGFACSVLHLSAHWQLTENLPECRRASLLLRTWFLT